MLHYTEFYKRPIKKKDILISKHKEDKYSDAIFTFDIETTSLFAKKSNAFTYNEVKEKMCGIKNKKNRDKYLKSFDKTSVIYIWQFSINNTVYYGRHIEEYVKFIKDVTDYYDCNITIFCHNLSFEFQHIRNLFHFESVFAREKRKVIYAKSGRCLYRCSYILSNSSLDGLTDRFNLPIQKKTGELDYSLNRHSETHLTTTELEYCEYDCLVLYEYIKHEKNIYGSVKKIPYTSTGKVRKLIKERYNEEEKNGYYNAKARAARLTPSLTIFEKLVKAFSGGYTHANATHVEKVQYDVKSLDFKSSYPAVMCLEQFPMYKFTKVYNATIEKILKCEKTHAHLLTIKINNLQAVGDNNYISRSKCENLINPITDNGRIAQADSLTLTITEQDLYIIEQNYWYTDYTILECYQSRKRYLDKTIVNTIDFLFKEKERLGKLVKIDTKYKSDYNAIKAFINSIYGMSVTNYITDEILYTNEWDKKVLTRLNISEKLEELEEKKTLALPYQVGVWVTAYARRNLWELINQVDKDLLYTDTDSIKFINHENYRQMVIVYNEKCKTKLETVRKKRKMDLENINGIGYLDLDSNCTVDGVTEETYQEFITLGAKKYCYRDLKGLHMTVSGVRKGAVVGLKDKISNFNKDTFFDEDVAKKNMITYNDNSFNDLTQTDYLGQTTITRTYSSANISPTTYQMSVSADFRDYLTLINNKSEYLIS